MKTQMSARMMLVMATIMGGADLYLDGPLSLPKVRERHPWDDVQLSKADRKDKTSEEIQELRKAKYEENS